MLNVVNTVIWSLASAAANLSLIIKKIAIALLVAGAVALSLVACGSTQRVCQGASQNIVVVPSTSSADLATSRAMAADVAREAVARAAASCGHLLVGMQDAHPEADLDLRVQAFVPESQTAYNRNPQMNAMRSRGVAFVHSSLLMPLANVRSSASDPFLGALVVIARELHARGYAPATIVLIGNGLDAEPAPDGGTVDLGSARNTAAISRLAQRLKEFQPLLRPLAGSCVILVGAGAGSTLPDATILASQALLGQALAGDHIGFVPTRSSNLPSVCAAAPAIVLGHPRPRTIVATLSSYVVFQLGSAALQSSAQAVLHGLLGPLAHAQAVRVDGFTDPTGGDQINIPLSGSRASTVAVWIERHAGVPASRVRTRGLGSSDPIATNATAAGRALNRRVVITIREG